MNRQNVSPQIEIMIGNLEYLTETIENRNVELQSEVKAKDEEIKELNEKLGRLKGQEEVKVTFANLF